jgi:hypothetical protein
MRQVIDMDSPTFLSTLIYTVHHNANMILPYLVCIHLFLYLENIFYFNLTK